MDNQKNDSGQSNVREVALHMLAAREHSTQELHQKLIKRKFDVSEIESTLNELIANNYLSDERYADVAVRSRLMRGDGPFKIRGYLLVRGVSDSIVNKHLPSDDEFWFERALEIDQKTRKKRKITKSKAHLHEAKVVRSRSLQTRGYPMNVIRRIVDLPKEKLP